MDTLVGIDIFSGAGGLSLGAEMAGIQVKCAIEKNESAVETFKNNIKKPMYLVVIYKQYLQKKY